MSIHELQSINGGFALSVTCVFPVLYFENEREKDQRAYLRKPFKAAVLDPTF